jgi:hypothetical protein
LRTSIQPNIKEESHNNTDRTVGASVTDNHGRPEGRKDNNANDDDDDEDYYKFYDYQNEDLNRLETDELKRRKNEMEKLYQKNAILPSNGEFVYDVRVS